MARLRRLKSHGIFSAQNDFRLYEDYFVLGTYLWCSKWSVFHPNIFLYQIFDLWSELFFVLRTFSVFNQINFLFSQSTFGGQHKCTTKKLRFTSHQTSRTIQSNTNPKCRASNTRLIREDENTARETQVLLSSASWHRTDQIFHPNTSGRLLQIFVTTHHYPTYLFFLCFIFPDRLAESTALALFPWSLLVIFMTLDMPFRADALRSDLRLRSLRSIGQYA